MNIIGFLISLTLLICFGCQKSELENSSDDVKVELARKVIRKAASELKKETELHPIGTISQMLRQIEVLGLSFYYYKPVDIAEGRKLLMQATNALIKTVNEEKEIYLYLSRYPFPPKNIEIRILLRNQDGRDVPEGALWAIIASEGEFQYKVDVPQKGGLKTIYRESYEQALERAADPSLPQ